MIPQIRAWSPKYIKNSLDSTPGRQTTQLKNGQRTWTDTCPRKTSRGTRDIWKDAQHHWPSERCKLKPQWGTISHRKSGQHKQIHKQMLERMWRKGNPIYCWWESRLVWPLWETVWNFLRKLKMELPFGPAIPLLGLYPKNPETPIQKNLCTPMFIAAQFTIAK